MDDLEELYEKGDGTGLNFIPCVKWVKRGAAKSQPEKVSKLSFMYLLICDQYAVSKFLPIIG